MKDVVLSYGMLFPQKKLTAVSTYTLTKTQTKEKVLK